MFGGFVLKSFTIYLFRHGLTKGNLNAQYIGHTDLPITTDSISALQKIKARHHYPKVDAVFVSPLKRCAESAAIMFEKNKPLVINELIEYDFGEFEGLTAKELSGVEDFKNWLRGDMYARPPGGESNAEFFSRVCGAFERIVDGMIKSSTQTAAIVCHAGVLMAILACYGLPEAPMAHWQMEAGYGFKLNITPSLWMRSKKAEVVDTSPISMNKEQ